MKDIIKKFLIEKNSAEDRYQLCENCEHFWETVKVCKVCKCYMPAKTKIKDVRCPLNKW